MCVSAGDAPGVHVVNQAHTAASSTGPYPSLKEQVPAFSMARALLVAGRSHLLMHLPPSVNSSSPVEGTHCGAWAGFQGFR